jgi:hypothetical protein
MKQSFLISIILLAASQARADGFLSLTLGVDARSAAMGTAATAVSRGAAAVWYNPALIALPGSDEVLFTHHRWIVGVRSSYLGLTRQLGRSGFGAYLLYTDMGQMEQRLVPSPEPAGTFSADELVLGFGWGREIAPGFTLGLGAKLLYDKIFVYDAWGFALDAGLSWLPVEKGPRLSLVLSNLGKTEKLDSERISLPLSLRGGISMPIPLPGGSWLTVLEVGYRRDAEWCFGAGTEYVVSNTIFLRFGFRRLQDDTDLTAGLGLALGKYRLDYGYMPLSSGVGDSHKISLAIDL